MNLTTIWSWFINDCPGIASYNGYIFVTPHNTRPIFIYGIRLFYQKPPLNNLRYPPC
jgi:hypothetical protein